MKVSESPLGKKSTYISTYNKSLLFPIPRKLKRDEIKIPDNLPFSGYDIWNSYELSWLDSKGKPQVAIAEFSFPCTSEYLIESKSFKLYLNSFNNTKIESIDEIKHLIESDLSEASKSNVSVSIYKLQNADNFNISSLNGTNIDNLDIEVTEYIVNKNLLQLDKNTIDEVEEELTSNLLKSNCLVTGQPDWGSLYIKYSGKKIDHESLLKYIISFRNHDEFHEQCVERIFHDIKTICKPIKLTVYARYTRRGGLDINPFRSNYEGKKLIENIRLARQ